MNKINKEHVIYAKIYKQEESEYYYHQGDEKLWFGMLVSGTPEGYYNKHHSREGMLGRAYYKESLSWKKYVKIGSKIYKRPCVVIKTAIKSFTLWFDTYNQALEYVNTELDNCKIIVE